MVPVGLASWRLASLLVNEAGPADVLLHIRCCLGVYHDEDGKPTAWSNIVASLFSCVWCMSVWTSALMLLVWWIWPPVVLALAASTVAVLVQEAIDFIRSKGGNHG